MAPAFQVNVRTKGLNEDGEHPMDRMIVDNARDEKVAEKLALDAFGPGWEIRSTGEVPSMTPEDAVANG